MARTSIKQGSPRFGELPGERQGNINEVQSGNQTDEAVGENVVELEGGVDEEVEVE